jgi:hypothetical protein
VLEKRKQKRIAAGGDGTVPERAPKPAKEGASDQDGKKQGYRQRQAVDGAEAMRGAGMESVLGNVFG